MFSTADSHYLLFYIDKNADSLSLMATGVFSVYREFVVFGLPIFYVYLHHYIIYNYDIKIKPTI